MGLGHLPEQTRFNDRGVAATFDNTWGHLAPKIHTSYPGIVRFVLTDHSQYGSQPIIMEYDFPNLQGPYLHDKLFYDVCDWPKKFELEQGIVYEIKLTFRNYRFYYGKPVALIDSMYRKIQKS